jgi:hypothetical protein
MKRKMLLLVATTVLGITNINAQEERCFNEGTSAINIGIGVGNTISYSNVYGSAIFAPAFTASYEYGIKHVGIGIIGAGLEFGYQGTHYNYANAYGYVAKEQWTTLAFSPRATYHFDFLNKGKFDVYPIVQINIYSYADNYIQTGNNGSGVIYSNGNYNNSSIGVRPSLLVAARYFFTPNIGVYSELGYDISIIKAGLSVKFGGK